jgi:hypothetical protein
LKATEADAKTAAPHAIGTEPWTTAKIIDQFQTDLARAHKYVVNAEFGHTLIVAKYYEMAEYLMFRIPVYRPIPPFQIDVRDLSPNLKRELAGLKRLDTSMFWRVTKMAVACIFENLNFDYFHRSVMRHLKIQFIGEEN